MDAAEVLRAISQQVSVCEKCVLHFSRKKAVPGEGPENARIMFIGEGPGFYENEQGRPFVGPSGKFLDELLANAGLNRSEVFVGNVVKCRPPGNRDPQPEELEACRVYLERQIQTINPKVIVTLGRYSMAHFLPDRKISAIHGKPNWVNGRLVVPMYHPAAALHQPALRNAILADFASLPKILVKGLNSPHDIEEIEQEKPAFTARSLFDMPDSENPQPSQPEKKDPDDGESPVQLSLF